MRLAKLKRPTHRIAFTVLLKLPTASLLWCLVQILSKMTSVANGLGMYTAANMHSDRCGEWDEFGSIRSGL